MQKMLKISKASIAGIMVLLVMLVLVRLFQEELFYDPLLDYFKGVNTKGRPLPQYNAFKLGLHLFFRYIINSFISLGIIWLIFKDAGIFKLSVVLYLLFFIVLIVSFYVILNNNNPDTMLLFYIRRFIIQPLFVILFVPAFYYQNKA